MSPSALARISLAAGRRHVAGRSDPVRPANELPLPAVDSARAQNWPVFTQLEARVVRMPTVDKVEEAFGSATLRFCSLPVTSPITLLRSCLILFAFVWKVWAHWLYCSEGASGIVSEYKHDETQSIVLLRSRCKNQPRKLRDEMTAIRKA